jgi:hypothetical protein
VAIKKHADGFRHYNNITQNQNIILARTGHKNKLNTPISFEFLKDKVLFLVRNKNIGTIDIIRILFQISIYFIANLLLYKETVFPESVITGPYISRETNYLFIK